MAIRVEVEYVDGGFTTRMLHAGETVEQFERNVGKAIKTVNAFQQTNTNFLGTLRDVTVTLGMASQAISTIRSATTGWAGDIVKVNAEFERLTMLMKGMSSASDAMADAKQQVRELRDFAKQTPYSMQGLADVFTKLKSGGLDPLKGSMQGLVNAVASFGGSEETMKRAALAMQQMAGKGVIQMEELRQQLGEAVPRATELMARAMGVTIGELVQAMSKGTVEAKRGLELLQGEFNRTFGGAAAQQMNTWNGLMQSVANQFQELQSRAGEAGFFDAVKDKARELVELMNSKSAGTFADSIGRGLTTVIGVIDETVRKVLEFKSEITAAAIVLGAGLGVRAVTSAMLALVGSISSAQGQFVALRTGLAGTAVNFAAVRAEIVATQAATTTLNTMTQSLASGLGAALLAPYTGFAKILDGLRALPGAFLTAVTSVAGFNSAMATLRAGLAVTAATVKLVAIALVELAPILIAVGAGISFAVQYFDLFGSKAKEARKEVEELGGAASKTSLKLFMKQIQEEERELAKLEKTRKSVAEVGIYVGSAGSGGAARQRRLKEIDDETQALKAKIEGDRALLNAAGTSANQNEAQKNADKQLRIFDEIIAAQRRQIDIYGKDMANAQNEALAAAAKAGKSTEELKADYMKRERERQLSIYDLEIAQAEQLYEEKRKTIDKLDGVQKDSVERELAGFQKRIDAAKLARAETEKVQIGVPVLSKPLDEGKLLEKGQKALQNLRDSIEGVKADLQGANRDVAQLQSALMAGKFGPIDNGQVKILIDELIQAQTEKSKLDDLLDGKNKFDRDAASLELSLRQQIFEEQTRGMSEVDKFKAKINSGFYQGIGPGNNPLVQSITLVGEGLQTAGTTAAATAKTIQEKLFGSSTLAGGNSLVDILKNAVEQIGKMKDGVVALSGAAAGITSSSQNGGNIVPNGAGGGPSGSYLDKLIKQESGGRTDVKAQTSSAVGLGQFIETTWIKFLNDMHPEEVRQMTKAQALALRTDSGMMKEAILWYARENAKVLSAAGVTVNDANLYLAHFLGPSGARKALTSSDDTSIASILPDAVGSNAFLRGKDVGWLKNWANAKFGTLNTATDPVQQNDSKLPMPKGVAPEGQASIKGMEGLEKELNRLKVDNALKDKVAELSNEIKKVGDEATGTGTKLSKVDAAIRDGVFGKGPGEQDPMSDRYKAVRAEAEKLDQAEKVLAENRKLRTRVLGNRDKTAAAKDDLEFKEQDLKDRFDRESQYRDSESLRRMRFDMAKAENAGRELISRGDKSWSEADQTALKESNLATFKRYQDLEVAEKIQAEQKKTREEAKSLMTADQAREASLQEEIRRLEELKGRYSENGEMRAQIEETIQEKIRVARAKTAASSPLGKQMKEWSDLGNNMEKAMTGWLDSGVDAIADFVTTGKADFKSLFQSIAKDITKMALKWSLSQMFGGSQGGGGLKSLLKGGTGAGGAKGAKAQGAAGAKGGGAKMFGAMHTGGIVGAGFSMSRMVNPAIFGSAPRFHTGGIIGADEVPIIAQRGEGVFTREQMAAMGGASGSNVVTIAPQVTVNASGGTPAQNADLAAQTAKAVEGQVRSIVVDELMTQLRPGNMLSR